MGNIDQFDDSGMTGSDLETSNLGEAPIWGPRKRQLNYPLRNSSWPYDNHDMNPS